MKMVKSLLLVSAAGLVASAGAQAADLPVKAKPVEYVKVCSLYGAGFYYIPGTDICLKIGAAFRAEYAIGNQASSLTNLDAVGSDGQRTRLTGPDYQQRARTYLWLDSRQQTAYGTLRAYMNVGWTADFPTNGTSAAGLYANRAFIQLAGFTWGVATSYYDFYSSPATSYSVPWSSDTGDGGWKVAAYTAQLGNGISATLSLEEPRRLGIVNTDLALGCTFNSGTNATSTQCRANNPYTVGGVAAFDTKKVQWPDVVGNLRVDQAWGSAQLMGALHDSSAGYYGSSLLGSQNAGHPDDKLGFAVGAGIKINFPMIGPGDYFQAQVNYTQGAVRYAATTPFTAGSPGIFGGGNTLGMGLISDGVYCGTAAGNAATATCPTAGQSVQQTTVWSVQAAYEHFWTPSLRTSLVGAYTDVSYNDTASQLICSTFDHGLAGNTATAGANGVNSNSISGSAALAGANLSANCGPGTLDWSYWSVSSRTQWNITKEFYIGLEGYYGHLNTMAKGLTASYRTNGAQPSSTAAGSVLRTFDDQEVFVYRMRVHRDIAP